MSLPFSRDINTSPYRLLNTGLNQASSSSSNAATDEAASFPHHASSHTGGKKRRGSDASLDHQKQRNTRPKASSPSPLAQRNEQTAEALSNLAIMADNAGNWRSGGGGGGGAPGGSSSWGHGAAVAVHTSSRGRGRGGKRGGGASRNAPAKQAAPTLPILPGPLHTIEELKNIYAHILQSGKIKPNTIDNPKSDIRNYMTRCPGELHKVKTEQGYVEGRRQVTHRATLIVDEEYNVVAYGDASTAKEAEKAASLHGLCLLVEKDLLKNRPVAPGSKVTQGSGSGEATAKLTTGQVLTVERAREFIEFYCRTFSFGKPDIRLEPHTTTRKGKSVGAGWRAEMEVAGQNIGRATASSKKGATSAVYVDTVQYLESSDPDLWKKFDETHKPGQPIGNAPHVYFRTSEDLDDEVRYVYETARKSLLYKRRPRHAPGPGEGAANAPEKKRLAPPHRYAQEHGPGSEARKQKSARLLAALDAYQTDERLTAMREQRRSLPVMQKASDVLVKIELNQVTIVMAATGSGKTTQIPQILFDDYILRNEGAQCNIICTQPRRIAAISVAQRVAKERGERIGETVGYQVRFDSKTPQPNGSITFCTTGVFLRRLQSALGEESATNSFLDDLTHVVVDEVHERDIETDLLLVVIKRLLAERQRLGKREIKLVLMSATIDPKLFRDYFTEPPPSLKQAPVVEIPGRSFPVDKHYLEETVAHLQSLNLAHNQGGWVWNEKNVRDYLNRELNQRGGVIKHAPPPNGVANGAGNEAEDLIDDLELPYPLVALMIADVIKRSNDGHVLVFMPGWDEIKAVNQILQDSHHRSLMGLNFNDTSKFEIHVLHSSVPVAEQQAVFEPPRDPSIRRIILSTNIAETSVTIPDVVYVVDTGRVKEKRYDAEKGLSSLVSAWVGTSNLNQRAGRAGRHRPGEYYGVLSKARYDQLNVNQTVEMKRSDLSNVVMHIKALDIPGMEVEDVLDAAIEPPAAERVKAAMDKLFMVGALDQHKNLTSLGRVLLQLPVDAAMGKMCLYGAFFRCLDPTLTLAAILTSRDPFMAPMQLKREADAVKDSWCPPDFRSDALTILRAFTRWWEMQSRGDYVMANRFCSDNFLSKVTLLQIQQVKEHLFSSLDKAGIIEVTMAASQQRKMTNLNSDGIPSGPATRRRAQYSETSPELNVNSGCAPLLSALIAVASAPNFAIRTTEKVHRTSQDKTCFIHPSSVCHLKHTKDKASENTGEREILAFSEKMRNVSMMTSSSTGQAQINLRGVTRLDPLMYMLFGANQVRIGDGGIYCDDWLPVKSYNFESLDNVERLKTLLDVCMLRVMEGCSNQQRGPARRPVIYNSNNDDSPAEDAPEAQADLSLSLQEIEEFEILTAGVVSILDHYSLERNASRGSTRPATPQDYYSGGGSAPGSGYNTPYGGRPSSRGGQGGPPRFGVPSISLGGHSGSGGRSGASSAWNSRPPSPGPSSAPRWRRGA